LVRVRMIGDLAASASCDSQAALRIVRDYHERTKHRREAYAVGPETLDWDSQPAPFRHFEGVAMLRLPVASEGEIVEALARPFLDRTLHEAIPISLASLGTLLQLAFGITAWKTFGPDRWAVRANPSSGNLHPIEAYLVLLDVPGVPAGVYHYRPDRHALERRARLAPAPHAFGPTLWVGLSSVMWREGWKYGERAFRYCQLDAGHALGALHYAAAALGWAAAEQPQVGTDTLAHALGLDRPGDFPRLRRADTEREEAELLVALGIDGKRPAAVDAKSVARFLQGASWEGIASPIDPHPMYAWPLLTEVARVTRAGDRPAGAPRVPIEPRAPAERSASSVPGPSVGDVILGRRSAQRFDAGYELDRDTFVALLRAVAPSNLGADSALSQSHRIDLVLFVLRVTGLDSGVYLLTRPQARTPSLVSLLDASLDSAPVVGAPGDLDLRRVARVESRSLARMVRALHCHQDLAAQASFVVAMVAEFRAVLERDPAEYRAIHREAGWLGHVFYLEAEARRLRATGIGCFFDDAYHGLLKLSDDPFQTVYALAVGKPVVDPRVESVAVQFPSVLTAEEEPRQP
jgi:SagB-type dehydrogenase family enzyme